MSTYGVSGRVLMGHVNLDFTAIEAREAITPKDASRCYAAARSSIPILQFVFGQFC